MGIRRVGATHVALLRGINLGGRATVAMADLRRLFEALGHTDVATYIQSGNVLFRPAGRPSTRVADDVEQWLARDLGVPATVVVRGQKDLARVAARNAFLTPSADASKLHVTFLAAAPARTRATSLAVPAGEPDELALVGQEVYLRCPNGYGRTKVNNAFIEHNLGVAATTRNWKTVAKLLDLMDC